MLFHFGRENDPRALRTNKQKCVRYVPHFGFRISLSKTISLSITMYMAHTQPIDTFYQKEAYTTTAVNQNEGKKMLQFSWQWTIIDRLLYFYILHGKLTGRIISMVNWLIEREALIFVSCMPVNERMPNSIWNSNNFNLLSIYSQYSNH